MAKKGNDIDNKNSVILMYAVLVGAIFMLGMILVINYFG